MQDSARLRVPLRLLRFVPLFLFLFYFFGAACYHGKMVWCGVVWWGEKAKEKKKNCVQVVGGVVECMDGGNAGSNRTHGPTNIKKKKKGFRIKSTCTAHTQLTGGKKEYKKRYKKIRRYYTVQ